MKKYTVVRETTITQTYIVEAESEEQAIEIAQEDESDFVDEEIDEDWNVEEY